MQGSSGEKKLNLLSLLRFGNSENHTGLPKLVSLFSPKPITLPSSKTSSTCPHLIRLRVLPDCMPNRNFESTEFEVGPAMAIQVTRATSEAITQAKPSGSNLWGTRVD